MTNTEWNEAVDLTDLNRSCVSSLIRNSKLVANKTYHLERCTV
jgi:hypothetical protein